VDEKALEAFADNAQIIISSPDKKKVIDSVVENELNKTGNKLSRNQLYALYNNSTNAIKGNSRSVADFMNDIIGKNSEWLNF
jgi:hypothetical protein